MSNLFYILTAVIMFGVLIFLHEFGHYLTARLVGISVEEFAIGFGPKLVGHTSRKTGIRYTLRLFLLGGFCRFFDEGYEEKNLSDPSKNGYRSAAPWRRFLVCVSGPAMNIVFALILFVVLFSCVGLLSVSTVIDDVIPGYPADRAGIEHGDRIIAVDGEQNPTAQTVSNAIGEGRKPVNLVLQRGEEQIELELLPIWIEEENRPMIGIIYATEAIRIPIWEAIPAAFQNVGNVSTQIVAAIRNIITRGEGLENVTGPVGSVAIISSETQTGGLRAYIMLAAVISVNLGIFNMLPVPGLDGSKIIFILYEKLTGKPIKPEREGMIVLIGMVLLIVLMIAVMYKDIMRLVR